MTREPFIAHSELTNEIYIVVGKEKYRVTEQAIKAVKAIKALEQEPCEDAVSRQAMLDAITEIDDNINMDIYTNEVREIIDDLPSVTPTKCIATVKFSKEDMQELIDEKMKDIVVERKKRKWLNKDASGYHFYGKCSECGQEFCVDAWYTQNMKFCPNCGAEMEGEEESK